MTKLTATLPEVTSHIKLCHALNLKVTYELISRSVKIQVKQVQWSQCAT
jgi:hypothetical protein